MFIHGAQGISLISRLRELFPDLLSQPFLVIRLVTPPRDEPLDCVQQLEPILKGRVWNGLPDFKSFFPMKKFPFPADVLGINLQFAAVVGFPFPTDFSFGHSYKSTLTTAIAAIPSSRPANPSLSFVVALTPTFVSGIPNAAAMFFFMAAMCGNNLGASAMTLESTFTIVPPLLATCAAASCKKILLGAFFQRGSVLGKKSPMSVSPIAPGLHRRWRASAHRRRNGRPGL